MAFRHGRNDDPGNPSTNAHTRILERRLTGDRLRAAVLHDPPAEDDDA